LSSNSDIRILDLQHPTHSVAAREVLAMVADVVVEFSPQAVQAAALEQLGGIELYEDPGLLDRLGLLCTVMAADADLSPMGRMTNFSMFTRYLVQRSRLEDLYRRHPEISAEQISQPLVIAGLPRSGTTHLLNLISVDERLRSLRYWESLEPIPIAAEQQLAAAGQDPRIDRCREQVEMMDQMMPLFRNMHDMSAEHIHEEVELQCMDFSSMLFDTYGLLPGWRDYYLAHDQTPHYEFLKRVLKALQWLRGPRRWILKSPQHLEQLQPLRTTFPDATFVLTHRDPVSVVTSMSTMQSYVARLSRNPVRPAEIAGYWVDRTVRQLQRCVADRDTLPPEQTIDVMFHEFMADDIGTVEGIYQLASHPMTPGLREGIQRYRQDNPRGKHGRVLYDLTGDFGIEPGKLREQFDFYCQRFPVQLET
jgi:hypothetical protein